MKYGRKLDSPVLIRMAISHDTEKYVFFSFLLFIHPLKAQRVTFSEIYWHKMDYKKNKLVCL